MKKSSGKPKSKPGNYSHILHGAVPNAAPMPDTDGATQLPSPEENPQGTTGY